jgi:hypothetical protein
MSDDDPLYDSFKQEVKERDGFQCVRDCGRRPPADKLRVVRIVPSKADTPKNLETVCQWCAPDWE